MGHGLETVVIGHSEAGLERCRKTIETNWDDLIKEGLATEQNKKAAMELVTITNDPKALEGATFVFEAVAEANDVTGAVYSDINKYAADNVIIASCTSSIGADILADLTEKPEQLLVAHPFQPAHMLPLVEVVLHDKTSKETVQRTQDILNKLHREVVVLNKSIPGFIVNRLAQALFRESIYMIEEGVTSAADIDKAVKFAVGMRYASIGLLEYYDDVGYDLETAIAKNVYPDLCDTKETQNLIKAGFESGKTGRAAGEGLYDWSKKDVDDFRYRKQAPYFEGVKLWDMPE
ncbi:MAG: 3-hydroxyacyl-CoA dehydrogenase family protein [Fastidiosipilaceae bacterium]